MQSKRILVHGAPRWVGLGTVLLALCLPAAAVEWPQEIAGDAGTIVVYQPQPESSTGNLLAGRAAVSLELEDREAPIFGAFWFESRIDTDRESGIVLIRDITVTQVAGRTPRILGSNNSPL